MMIRTLAAGAALAMLVAGGASAGTPKASTASTSPKQPIPYAQLDAYMKASAKERASKDWWGGSASTGMSADTSATAPAAPSTTTTATPPADTSVNPPASTSMPSDSSTSMPSTPPTMPESTTPAPGSNLPGGATTPGAPTEPK
mgnify:CR=1 FL=1